MKFFHRIAGITALSLKSALRTKTTVVLLILLLAAVTLLPRVVKGDGTPEGSLHILLTYTLGFSIGLLSLSTLWSSCALFAAEIDSTRIHLTAVKPVRPYELWLGKWFALVLINLFMLGIVYLGVYIQIRWKSFHERWPEARCPAARLVARPLLPSPEEEARILYARMSQRGEIPTNLTERAVLRTLREKAVERYTIINPGEEIAWKFLLKEPIRPGDPLTLRIRFVTEFSTRSHVSGRCLIKSGELPEREIEIPLDDFTQNEISLTVDTASLLTGSTPRPAPALSHFNLTFSNLSDGRKSSALMLRLRKDLALLTPSESFEMNLLRSSVVHLSLLALLSAFGLTLSACFSLPVAAFSATVLLMLCIVGNNVVEIVAEEDEAEWKNKPGIWISRTVHTLTREAIEVAPLTSISRGEKIGGEVLLSACGWNLLALPLLFGLLTHLVLSRRELADGD